MLIGIAITVALAYAAVMIALVLLEPRLLFPAPQVPREDLDLLAHRIGVTPVDITSEDGTSLYAWRAAGGPKLLLYFSGNASSVGHLGPRLQRFVDLGLTVLHTNYRGYPGSAGQPSEAGLLMDARAAWDHARRTHSADQIVVYGRSLGGGVAMGLVAGLGAEAPGALVLEASFTSAADRAQEIYPFLPVRLLMRNPFDSLARAPSVRSPTLIIHGDRDEVVPFAHGEALQQAIHGAALVPVAGRGHNEDLLSDPRAWREFQALVAGI